MQRLRDGKDCRKDYRLLLEIEDQPECFLSKQKKTSCYLNATSRCWKARRKFNIVRMSWCFTIKMPFIFFLGKEGR